MTEHIYEGVISFGYAVISDKPLTKQEIIDGIAINLTEQGIPECDLGDIDHFIDGKLEEN